MRSARRLPTGLLALAILGFILPAPAGADPADSIELRRPWVGDAVAYRDADPAEANNTWSVERFAWEGEATVEDAFGTAIRTLRVARSGSNLYFDFATLESIGHDSTWDFGWSSPVLTAPFRHDQASSSAHSIRAGGLDPRFVAQGLTWTTGASHAFQARPDAFHGPGARTLTLAAAGWVDREGERLFRLDASNGASLYYDGVLPWPRFVEHGGGFVQTLDAYTLGAGPVLWDADHVSPPSAIEARGAPRETYTGNGPAGASIAGFTLSDAAAEARANATVAAWLASHPEAFVTQGRGLVVGQAVEWILTFSEADAILEVTLHRGDSVLDARWISIATRSTAIPVAERGAVVGRSLACVDHAAGFARQALGESTAPIESIHFSVLSNADLYCRVGVGSDDERYRLDGPRLVEEESRRAHAIVAGASGGMYGLSVERKVETVGLA